MTCKEPLSRYAQIGSGIQVEQTNWIDTLVEDKRASVPDQVAAKMDVSDWFSTLASRMKQIALDLAYGHTTSEVAAKYGVTAGRISQLRRTLEESWRAFQQEASAAIA
jgi:DNA-directed RNA polymerase sigma subunit (sigma70/sigma32)